LVVELAGAFVAWIAGEGGGFVTVWATRLKEIMEQQTSHRFFFINSNSTQ